LPATTRLLPGSLSQLHGAVRSRTSARDVAILSIDGARSQLRKVNVGSPARNLVIDHDPAGASEQMRRRYAARGRGSGTTWSGCRRGERRAFDEAVGGAGDPKEHMVGRSVVELGPGEHSSPRVLFTTHVVDPVEVIRWLVAEGEHIHFGINGVPAVPDTKPQASMWPPVVPLIQN